MLPLLNSDRNGRNDVSEKLLARMETEAGAGRGRRAWTRSAEQGAGSRVDTDRMPTLTDP